MAVNASVAFGLPPLPTYTLTAQKNLLAPLPDNVLSLILPVVAYWGMSMIYHFLDVNDYFVEYRLHTPQKS
ncbi:Fatty acid hydroxylase [Penicillium expansum]|nr:Fatty acid hydroxylase [Penicillium expansum]